MANSWRVVAEELATVALTLTWGSFLILDYDPTRLGENCPFVQAAPGPPGWFAEVVSERFLPAGAWPLDRAWLRGAAWNAPDASTDNWWCDAVAPDRIVDCLIDALRCARSCLLPDVVRITTGRFPLPPIGGETLLHPVDALVPRRAA